MSLQVESAAAPATAEPDVIIEQPDSPPSDLSNAVPSLPTSAPGTSHSSSSSQPAALSTPPSELRRSPEINSIPPVESPRLRPLTSSYLSSLSSSSSLSSLPPLPPIASLPAQLLPSSLSSSEYTEQLFALLSNHSTISSLSSQSQLLQSTLQQLQAHVHSLTLSRAHSVAHLQREILRYESKVHTLLTERAGLIRQVENIQQEAARSIREEKERLQAQYRRMEAELVVTRENYRSLNAFASDKSTLESELSTLRLQLEDSRRQHNYDVCQLERRNILEKEKMKNSMLCKIRLTKLSLLAQTEDQLSVMTRRTMLENQQVITELMYQSKETERMSERFAVMEGKEREGRRAEELWQQEKAIVMEKLILYGKIIRQYQQKEREQADNERQLQQQQQLTVSLPRVSRRGGGGGR